MNSNDLKTMIQKQYAEGMGNVKVEDIGCCSTCAIAKMTREPFESRVRYAAKPLEVIHTNVCGPLRTTSKGGARWFVTFIDEHTRFCHVYLMKEKSQVTERFVEFKNMVEKQTGHSIKELQSDGGGEYDNRKLDNLCKDAGIKRRFTVPHTPQQNGLAERKNRTLVETASCLLTQSGLPKSFWAEAIMTANYIRNRCYTNTIGCTPYEKWTGRKPDVSHMRPFGEKVYALDKTPTKGKFDCRGLEGYFLGYADNSKAYRVWLVNARKIICSRDVKFSNKFDNSLIEYKPDASHDSNIVDLSTQTVPAPDLNPIGVAEPDDDLQSKTNVDPHDEALPHGSLNLQDEPKRAQQDQASNDASTKNELFNRAVPTVNPDAVKPYEGHVTRSRTRLNRLAASESAMSACEVDIKDALSGPHKAAWFEAMREEIKSLIKEAVALYWYCAVRYAVPQHVAPPAASSRQQRLLQLCKQTRGKFKGRFMKIKSSERKEKSVQGARKALEAKKRKSTEPDEEEVGAAKSMNISGSRIVNIETLKNNMWCYACQIPLSFKNVIAEQQKGLVSFFTIACTKCKLNHCIKTNENEINDQLALGMLDTGTGTSQINSLLSTLDIPTVSKTTMKRHERIVGVAIEDVAKNSCVESILLEKKLAEEK
uniref:Integrase catalytic domain-containing protein n=1 Tax=Trichogramma kaykai TaxID=54128 RepID=A0ABD2WA73_9HYME